MGEVIVPDLKVALLWHLHQPSYWDPRSEKYRYPWVFLHTARHYHSMATIARDCPETRMTFNFTPVLLEQLDHYVTAEKPDDRILEAILKPAEELDRDELSLVLDHVFNLHLPTMVLPFPRYKELYGLLGRVDLSSRSANVRPGDIRDLQVLYLLTWCGVELRRFDPVKSLIQKQGEFTESDKLEVYRAMVEAARETLGLYRELQERGQIEITTTPYYHPILPLIVDASSAEESRPGVHLEEIDFRYPEDATWHVEEAVKSYRERFKTAPLGVWPSEGSVSDGALEILARNKIEWAGTDEGVLARSLGKHLSAEEKYRPYRFGDTELCVYFRDRELSDRIGFVYSGWDSREAVDDLIGRLQDIRASLPDLKPESCVTIILDGENPWEYYPDMGLGFLSGFYEKLASTEGLESVRFGDHRREIKDPPTLHHIVPGSWIDSNFDTWIGSPKKNHAWKLLAATRRKIQLERPDAPVPNQIYRAEGSDWFWWLGPGHDTPYESSYENIFRLNLRSALESLELEVPDLLESRADPEPTRSFQPPTHLATPSIDGLPGSYYDWIASGYYLASEGSFHRVHRYLDRLRFAFDLEHLYLRIEGDLLDLIETQDSKIVIEFNRPGPQSELVYSNGSIRKQDGDGKELPFHGKAAHAVFLEMAIPFSEIHAAVDDPIEFAVSVIAGGNTLDRIPQSGSVVTRRPDADFGQENWSV